MRKASFLLSSGICFVALLVCSPVICSAQNREKFVISAKAGGINAVTGRASVHGRGTSEWQQLTIKEDLEAGDVVKTGLDGRVEMLLNPGSYLRVGENSEFELTNNSLDNLEVRVLRGTAIVEATGADDTELLINISTPDARMSIVRRGLYRVNVVPGDGTELIVRKGRVMLEDSHTKIKAGNKVVFTGGSFSVAKLEKQDKKNFDNLEAWSKERADMVAKANRQIKMRELTAIAASFNDPWYRGFANEHARGAWVYHSRLGCFTFVPFVLGWDSPYGSSYSNFLYNFGCISCGYGNVGYGVNHSAVGNGAAAPQGAVSNPVNTNINPVRSMPSMSAEPREIPAAAQRHIDRNNPNQ